jgi:hypothetical protein
MIPSVEDIIAKLSGKTYFTVFNQKNGFWHIELDEKSIHLCTFISHFGCYRLLRLPFGLKGAPQMFQKFTLKFFSGIKGVTVYFDDLLVAAESLEQHVKILKEILDRDR